MSYTKYTADAIAKFGNEKIKAIELRRNPIPGLANKLVNFLEADSWSNVKFDTYYHLYSVLTLESGQVLKVEKNETINVDGKPEPSDMILPIHGTFTTLNEMLTNTQKQLGDNYFPYDPVKNNCQNFQMAFIGSNGLMTPGAKDFILQSTEKLAKNIPGFLDKINGYIFKLASWLRGKKEDLGLKKGGVVRRGFGHSTKKSRKFGH